MLLRCVAILEEDFYRNDYPEGDEDASGDEAGSDMSPSDEDSY